MVVQPVESEHNKVNIWTIYIVYFLLERVSYGS